MIQNSVTCYYANKCGSGLHLWCSATQFQNIKWGGGEKETFLKNFVHEKFVLLFSLTLPKFQSSFANSDLNSSMVHGYGPAQSPSCEEQTGSFISFPKVWKFNPSIVLQYKAVFLSVLFITLRCIFWYPSSF